MSAPDDRPDEQPTADARPHGRGPVPHGHVTLSDVARFVGVSAQSVSNALNNPARVAPETRARILAAVEQLGYRPNRSARALRNQRSRLIGIRSSRRATTARPCCSTSSCTPSPSRPPRPAAT